IAFAENQLFPSLIGLSPLATTHPRLFQQTPVRPSSGCYPTFNLVMARSLGFGSNPTNLDALFRLAFAAPTPIGLSLLVRLSRWPIIQKVRGHPLAQAPTVCRHSVSGLFHSPRRGAFHLSLTVLVRYRSLRSTSAWRVVPPRSDRLERVPPYSRTILCITRTGLSPTAARLSKRFRLSWDRHWPGPLSLATTSGVSVDVLSSGY